MLSGAHRILYDRLARHIPPSRLVHDALRALAYGTDASFYRLIPQLVVKVETEREVVTVLREAADLGVSVTFRAAGTSLSGQAVTDSVLVLLGRSWAAHEVRDGGERIRLGPGVIGSHANAYLTPYRRKIGPDPASINSAMIGGIAANNASGMCCGTAQNSYRTLEAMRIIFADGATLDTGIEESRAEFSQSHGDLLRELSILAQRVRATPALAHRIRTKYAMKNTTGYGLNALVDFENPIDILQHLMIGSEGTLGFIAEILYRTVPDHPHKATSLVLFPDISTACAAVVDLTRSPVDAVELMDRASLRSVEGKEGMPDSLKELDPGVAALLIETRAASDHALAGQVRSVLDALRMRKAVRPPEFTSDPSEYTKLWNIRKGLFPSVGAMRLRGTTVVIEDVAFPVHRLAAATTDLQTLFRKHGYNEAIIFGHALEGNLHFVFTQDFNAPSEVLRYKAFLNDVTSMVVNDYDGSLKAEHGTGRNMAPFVEFEWGREAYLAMRDIKRIFDPRNILNPGVILNSDPEIHLRNLKPLPVAHETIDSCIECGFCEVHCPSRNLTLTPRQRIAVYREIARLRRTGRDGDRLHLLESGFRYEGDQTCATDGLCATSCPVGIDTGVFVKDLRHITSGPGARYIAGLLADHMSGTTAAVRTGLRLVHAVGTLVGPDTMSAISRTLRRISGNRFPLWNPALPRAADALPAADTSDPAKPAVVYFPTCINRTMGVHPTEPGADSLARRIVALLRKAGYRVLYPEGVSNLCCGMAFASKGFVEAGNAKSAELERALLNATGGGAIPVVTDMSPCLLRMKEKLSPSLRLYEPVQFIREHLAGRLHFTKLPRTIAIHTTCSAEKMGLAEPLRELAERCAERVIVPHGIGCCGWAGDRGFTFPELNASALHDLRSCLPDDCRSGYSTSRTCEIGLTLHSGIPYRSIVDLVDEATTSPLEARAPS